MSLRLTDESILRLEAARDRQRHGQPPAPAPDAEPTPAPQQVSTPTPSTPLPEGSVVLSKREWKAVAHLIETHPETRDIYRQTSERF